MDRFGEMCKCIFYRGARNTPIELRNWANDPVVEALWCRHVPVQGKRGHWRDRGNDRANSRLRWNRVHKRTGTESLSGGATYGFAVKPEWYGSLFEIPIEQQAFVSGAFQVPVGNALEFKWPALDQYKAPTTAGGVTQSAIYAGFQLFYKGEITQRTYSDAALDMINVQDRGPYGFHDLVA